jgi:serine/threonine protein kinase
MAAAPPPTAPPGDRKAPGPAGLAGQYTISPDEPFAALTQPSAPAFRAVDRRFPAESLAAIVCSGEVVPRIEVMATLRGIAKPGLLPLVAFGPIDWPGGRQRLAAVYSAPQGGRFALSTPLTPYQIVDGLLRPAAVALKELHSRSLTHRGIRPDNLFLRTPGAAALALGPSVAVPPGFAQPDIYEPLDTAPADPVARGPGSTKHDMFALGMTALALLLGRQPGSEFDRDTLMIRRYERGSLDAVVDMRMLPREIVDALHGLTADDERERWSVDDLQKWLNGGRPDMPRSYDARLALAPYEIGGRQIRTARALGYMLGRNWVEGARHLRRPELSQWLRDYAPERTAAAMLEQALAERGPDAEADDGDALLVSNAVAALDPHGPIRYRGVAVDASGLGSFVYEALNHPERRAVAAGLIRNNLPQRSLDRRPDRRLTGRRATRQAINFERLRRWVLSAQPWEGLERCLYDLNLNLPCLSPMAGGRWVGSVAELVVALDEAALKGTIAEATVDSHVAAFIGARFDATGDALLTLMKPKDADHDATLGAIRMFAELQQSLGSPPLRGLAKWCGTLAHRVADGIHHRPSRQALHEGIDRAVPSGSIATILKLVDMPTLKSRDDQGFTWAKSEHGRLQFEIRAIESSAEARRQRARQRARDNAALLCGAGSLVVMFLTLFLDSGQ